MTRLGRRWNPMMRPSFGCGLVWATSSLGCAQILGFDEPYETTAQTAGTGGVSGVSGAAGHSGVAGNAGLSGAAGVGGSGGSAGTSASGGSSGNAGTGGIGATGGVAGNAGTSGVAGSGGIAGSAGNGGDSGAAGSGGAVDPCDPSGMALGVLGMPCCAAHVVVCNGHAQRVQMSCGNGVWQVLSTCNGDSMCDPSSTGAASCQPVVPVCMGQQPGAIVCEGASLSTCGPDLVTVQVETCASASHCQQSSSFCVICLQGTYACDGKQPKICAADGMGYIDNGLPCDELVQCKPDIGVCTPLVCTEGSFRCQASQLEGCDTSANAWGVGVDCGTGICDAANGQCDVCLAGEISCASTTERSICHDDGQASTIVSCPALASYCVGQGVCVDCTSDADCTAVSVCQSGVCNNGGCDFVQKPDGFLVSTLNLDDCKKRVCLSGVSSIIEDPLDHLADTTVCRANTCLLSAPYTTDSWPGTPCEGGLYCGANGGCTEAVSGSCIQSSGPNLASCGATSNSGCCASMLVPATSFHRGYDAASDSYSGDTSAPATVSEFHLDTFEVSVGRFRNFVRAVVQGWSPSVGSGKHRHLPGGAIAGETGWQASWPTLPVDAAGWNASLGCDPTSSTWTPQVGSGEGQPINCVSWYQAYAFCIFDDGFLPTEAEWALAASGGIEQRAYPWSSPPGATTISSSLASYLCLGDGSLAGVCAGSDLIRVGQLVAGDGLFGHHDLGGNVAEWTLDASGAYPVPCTNCAQAESFAGQTRVTLGGSYSDSAASLRATQRVGSSPAGQNATQGVRCARP